MVGSVVAHGNTAVKLGKTNLLPGCAGFYGLGQFFHVHRVYAVCNGSKPAVDQGLCHGAAGVQDDGRVEDDLAFHRVAMDLLIQLQSRLIRGEQEIPPLGVVGDHIDGAGLGVVDGQPVPVPQDILHLLVFQQPDFFAAHITVDFSNGLAITDEHIGSGGYDDSRQDAQPDELGFHFPPSIFKVLFRSSRSASISNSSPCIRWVNCFSKAEFSTGSASAVFCRIPAISPE